MLLAANQNNNKNGDQSSQALNKSKKNSCLYHRSWGLFSNILITRINATAVKKDMKVKVDLSPIKYYNCDKKGHYSNKCIDKQSKN